MKQKRITNKQSKQDYPINDQYQVHITVCQRKDGKFGVSGYLITSSGVRVDNKSPRTKTAECQEDIQRQIHAVIATVASQIETPKKKEATNVKTPKNAETSPLRNAITELHRDGSLLPTWNDATRGTCLTYFLNHTIRFLENSDFDLISTQSVYDFLRSETENSGRSTGIGTYIDSTAKRHLCEAALILAAAQKLDPDILAYDISLVKRSSIMFEQIKALPEPVRQKLRRLVETKVKSEPKMVRAAVFMIDGGLRTAEAAAVLPCDLEDLSEEHLSVIVGYQEKDGLRCDRVKTDNGYRIVPLSFWGTTLIRECNRQIDDDEESKSPVRAANLSAWVLNLLKEAGLKSDIIDTALFAETTFPDQDEQGKQYYDISAYILRRDRATIYKTICGLSTEDIDYLLGHFNKTAKRRKADLRLTEQRLRIGQALERYVSSMHLSAHPGITGLQIKCNDDFVLPAYNSIRLHNTTDKEMLVEIDAETLEAGETISIGFPKDALKKRETRKRIAPKEHSQPIIGSNIEIGGYPV